SNVFAVSKDGKIEHLKDAKVLEMFFRQHGATARNEEAAGTLAQGWLWLAQEFVQDGFYAFTLGKPEVKTEGGKVNSASDTAVGAHSEGRVVKPIGVWRAGGVSPLRGALAAPQGADAPHSPDESIKQTGGGGRMWRHPRPPSPSLTPASADVLLRFATCSGV